MLSFEEFIQKRYNEELNYEIADVSDKKICYIFCSSNGIYSDVTNSNADKEFKKNFYEWKNISKHKRLLKNAGKYIFLRDPKAKFYIEGINKNTNTIDKLIDLIKAETKGFDVVLVGFSSGGMLSIILSYYLDNVKRVYCFGGIVSLYTFTGAKNQYRFNETDFFKAHLGNNLYEKWYSIKSIINRNKVNIYYFYGTNSVCDLIQLKEIENPNNFYLIPINSKHHGGEIYGFCYPYLLTLSDERLIKISKKTLKKAPSKRQFSRLSAGIVNFYKELLRKAIHF